MRPHGVDKKQQQQVSISPPPMGEHVGPWAEQQKRTKNCGQDPCSASAAAIQVKTHNPKENPIRQRKRRLFECQQLERKRGSSDQKR
ncbi:hypothetical protein CEXT_273751 [Caerostris extrusa]|uniref:Uncharacterized protein n=1 Tax=Caerostris extrusa TaxID=172846 RepID=A0AAV4M6U3_CAEEX|nr:hypothetical protein CEXT_273751 [Caerostris extrusa]